MVVWLIAVRFVCRTKTVCVGLKQGKGLVLRGVFEVRLLMSDRLSKSVILREGSHKLRCAKLATTGTLVNSRKLKMKDKQVVDSIRNYFEQDNGWQLSHDLFRFKHIEKYLLPNQKLEKIIGVPYFKSDSAGFLWDDDYLLKTILDRGGEQIYRFENGFKVSGELSYWIEGSPNEYKAPCSFSLTLRVHKYPNSGTPDYIELWDEEQKIINHFNELIYAKYDALNFESPISKFDKFTESWSSVNRNDENQIKATSYHYYFELVHAFEQAMYLVANVNLYSKFTSNYTEKESHTPNGIHFIINLSFYDRRYLDFCSLAFEKIYAFWERVAFLLYQFIKPVKKPLAEKQVSFFKLIDNLCKDIESGNFSYLKNSASTFIWFNNFLSREHKKLTDYRHPAIHFQMNNSVYKGGLFAGTHNYWLENNDDKNKLTKLQKDNEDFCKFLNDQLRICETGLNKVVELIKEIPVVK